MIRPMTPLNTLRNRTGRHITTLYHQRTGKYQRVGNSTLRTKTSRRLTINTVGVRLRLVKSITKGQRQLNSLRPLNRFLRHSLTKHNSPNVSLTALTVNRSPHTRQPIRNPHNGTLTARTLNTIGTRITLRLNRFRLQLTRFRTHLNDLRVRRSLQLLALLRQSIRLRHTLRIALTLPANGNQANTSQHVLRGLRTVTRTANGNTVSMRIAILTHECIKGISRSVTRLNIRRLPFTNRSTRAAILSRRVTTSLTRIQPTKLRYRLHIVRLRRRTSTTYHLSHVIVRQTLMLRRALVSHPLRGNNARPFIRHKARSHKRMLNNMTPIPLRRTSPRIRMIFLNQIRIRTGRRIANGLTFFSRRFRMQHGRNRTLLIRLPNRPYINLSMLP